MEIIITSFRFLYRWFKQLMFPEEISIQLLDTYEGGFASFCMTLSPTNRPRVYTSLCCKEGILYESVIPDFDCSDGICFISVTPSKPDVKRPCGRTMDLDVLVNPTSEPQCVYFSVKVTKVTRLIRFKIGVHGCFFDRRKTVAIPKIN